MELQKRGGVDVLFTLHRQWGSPPQHGADVGAKASESGLFVWKYRVLFRRELPPEEQLMDQIGLFGLEGLIRLVRGGWGGGPQQLRC